MNAHVELILAMVFASFMAILIILCQLLFGYYSNEMATLHLIKSYCVPSVLYVSAVSLPLSPASTRCFFLLLYLSNPFVYIHLLFTVLLCWLINLIDLI